MGKEQELRPCPCGHTQPTQMMAREICRDLASPLWQQRQTRIWCLGCGATIIKADAAEARAAWNRRSSDEQAEVVGVPAATIIAMRDALLAGELNEAYHQLYTIADPEFCQMEPWRNIEHKASLASPPAVAKGGVTEARVERLHTELCRSWQTEAWISGPPIDTIRRVLTAALAVD